MALTGKERAELRAEAHHLEPTVHVGHHGLTDAVVQSLEDALHTHELVKVQLGKTTEGRAKDLAWPIAERVRAEVVQVIGRTFTIWRENPELRLKEKRREAAERSTGAGERGPLRRRRTTRG